MRIKLIVAIACLLMFFTGSAFADEMLSVKAGYQVMSPSGTFAGESNGVGTRIDMEDNIAFDDSKDVTAEIAVQLGNSRLSFNYLPLSFSGTGTGTFTFNGKTFTPANGSVSSEISADIYDIGYTYYLLNFDDLPSRFQLGVELAIKVIEGEASLSQTLSSLNETASGTAPIPTLGLRARVALGDFIGVSGRVGYLEFDDNSFLDADVQVEFSPLPMAGIYGGYRIFELDVNESDLLLDVEFSGPYAGVFVRF